MSVWPDTVEITRAGAGSMGADDVYVRVGASKVHFDEADVQDDDDSVRRDPQGNPESGQQAVAYVRDETMLDKVKYDDDAKVTFADGSDRAGRVVGTRKLDGKILLKWLD